MIDDVRTVVWKEWKALFRQRGGTARVLLTLLVPVGLFAIYVPLDAGHHWLTGATPVFPAIVLPMLSAFLTVPNAFAGERERHTLPTLLASRLPDRAILLGKAMFSILLGVGLVFACNLTGLVVVNVAHAEGELLFWSPKVLLASVLLTLLGAGLTTGVGIVVSLRAATVQEAQQTMTAVLLLPPTLLGPIVLLVGRQLGVVRVFDFLGTPVGMAVLFGGLAIADLLLVRIVAARFQRERLIAE